MEYNIAWKGDKMFFGNDNVPENTPNSNKFLGQLPSANQHDLWGIAIGSVVFLILYAMGKYDYALFVLGVILGGVFVDLYIHGYQH